jgi:uncharacterized DUF497 family protein
MIFEWDQNKNSANKAKHNVSFETASLVFFDEFHRTLFDRTEKGEDRWHTIGMVEGVVLLLVVHTYVDSKGEEVIRIISARRPTRKEKISYEQGD